MAAKKNQQNRGVNWDLIWKVLASVFAFAGSLATVYDLVGKIRSDAQTFYSFVFPGLAVIVWAIILIQLIRKKNPYVIPLLVVTVLGGVVGGVGWRSYNKTQEDKVIVLVAKFDGPEDQYGLQRQILDSLQTATEEYDDIVIIEGDKLVTTRNSAREEGSKQKADLVIWAWYRPTEDPNITLHIENLSVNDVTFIGESETYHPQATIAQLESFEIQRALGSETSTLVTFLTGFLQFQSGEYQTAVERFEKILQLNDTSTFVNRYDLYYYLGYSRDELEDYANAIEDYTKALEIDPQAVNAYNNRGVSYTHWEKYDLAIQDYSSAIEIDPQYFLAYLNRGEAYFFLDQHEKSIQDYTKAISIKPEDAYAYNNRGFSYSLLGIYDQAIVDFNEAIKIDPNLFTPYYNRGNIFYEQGNYQIAIQDFDTAIKLYNKDQPPYYLYLNRGLAYEHLGKYKLAIRDYDKSIKLNPNYATVYRNRGLAYEALGKTAEAEADFKKYEELTGEKP